MRLSQASGAFDSIHCFEMTFSKRFHEIRTGFERPFWIANISELFERLSYYAAFASLPRYLHESLNFGVQQASSLAGFASPLLMPGITLSTNEKDHELYGHLWLQRFDGSVWIPFGKALPV